MIVAQIPVEVLQIFTNQLNEALDAINLCESDAPALPQHYSLIRDVADELQGFVQSAGEEHPPR